MKIELLKVSIGSGFATFVLWRKRKFERGRVPC